MQINWVEVEAMSPEQIENLRVEQLKELQIIEDGAELVQNEYDQKARQIITLEGEKKDLQMSLRKARHTIKMKKTDIEILQTKFWQSRR